MAGTGGDIRRRREDFSNQPIRGIELPGYLIVADHEQFYVLGIIFLISLLTYST